jgi:hypothetical protein
MESLSGMKWNHCPASNGMGVRDGLEYATPPVPPEGLRVFGPQSLIFYAVICAVIFQICSFLKPLKVKQFLPYPYECSGFFPWGQARYFLSQGVVDMLTRHDVIKSQDVGYIAS